MTSFKPEIILCGVRRYLGYSLGCRDVGELMLDRGRSVDHTTMFRWVQRNDLGLDKRVSTSFQITKDSFRVEGCVEILISADLRYDRPY